MRAAYIPTTPGQGEGEGRLVIRFHYYSAPLVSPEGWPPRLSPKPGETLVSLWDRDIVGDRFLLLVTARTTRAPVPPLDGRHPAELTFAWWEKEWPYREYNPMWDAPPPRNYYRDRVYWRLGVGLFDQLRDGDLVIRGHRPDMPAYPLEVVERGLLRNPYMALSPRAQDGGSFRPEQWYGKEPPLGLPWYSELTVWPAEAAEAKRAKTPRQLTADSLVSLHGEGVDIRSPASVAALHKLAQAKSGVKVSKATLERALSDARISLQSIKFPQKGS